MDPKPIFVLNQGSSDDSAFDVNKKLREFWPKQRAKIRQMPLVYFFNINKYFKIFFTFLQYLFVNI